MDGVTNVHYTIVHQIESIRTDPEMFGERRRKRQEEQQQQKDPTSLKINRIIVFITQKITNAIPFAMAQAYYGLPATRAYFVSLLTAICTYTIRTHTHTQQNTHSICNYISTIDCKQRYFGNSILIENK